MFNQFCKTKMSKQYLIMFPRTNSQTPSHFLVFPVFLVLYLWNSITCIYTFCCWHQREILKKDSMGRMVASVHHCCPIQRSAWPLCFCFFWWFLLISIQYSLTFNALLLRWFFNVFFSVELSMFSSLTCLSLPPHHHSLLFCHRDLASVAPEISFQNFPFSVPTSFFATKYISANISVCNFHSL